jgi:YD repeat-containing protein
MPAFNSNLEFTRSFSSREANKDPTGPLGPGWKLGVPMEAAGSPWSGLKLETFTETFEEEEPEAFQYKWAALKDVEGGELDFEETSAGHWATPPEVSGYVLQEVAGSAGTEIALSEPEGNRTVFWNGGSGTEYRLKSVSMTGGAGNKTRYIYGVGSGGRLKLEAFFAPAAPGVDCSGAFALSVPGCRALNFIYSPATKWGAPESAGERLEGINFRAEGFGGEFSWPVARFEYDTQGRLSAEYDMRIFPRLKETYTYEPTGQLKTITPPGQEPWTMVYGSVAGETPNGRLVAVKRPSLVATNPTAQTTISYGVPLSGASAPYVMSGVEVLKWGQTDVPVDATAIFPPNEVPASPPSAYTRATVYYIDAEGQISNVATPLGAGTSAPSITTTEADKFGNVVRELSAQNRLRALQAAEPAVRSHQIDTQYRYSSDGTELQEERGPLHSVKLKSGATTEARAYRSVQYTEGGEPAYHLPVLETTGALLKEGTPEEEVVDKRTTKYEYNLELRKPTKTIVDPNGLNIITETAYDKETGLPIETRQPKAAGSLEATAGMTKIAYYKKGGSGECEKDAWAGLPCKIYPAAAAQPAGLPQLPVRKILAYNAFAEPTEISESPGGGTEDVRLTKITYDNLGRQTSTRIEGGGKAIPKVQTEYSSTLGVPTVQKFVCEPECADNQAVTTGYDKLGRPVSYEDADGNKATTTFDYLGRPETMTDAKGSQKYRYDSVTGLLTELEDSGAGTFTATYNADGSMATRGLPNGITATTEYDEIGSPVHLAYTKQTSCGESCTWLDFDVEDSIDGQILSEASNLVNHAYIYDAAGRLTQAQETPIGGACTTRTYNYDKDSNRLSRETATAILGGGCLSGGGTKQAYSYDTADRLTGVSYDSFGRIKALPKAMAGGTTLETSYFSTDMVATQSQNGITNAFELDASLRQRQRLQGGGGLEGTEVFHYDAPGDAPAWSERAGDGQPERRGNWRRTRGCAGSG